MENVIEMICDGFNKYELNNPDKINKVYSYFSRETIYNFITWLGDIKDFNSKDYEEFFKQKYMIEAQDKINVIKDSYNKLEETHKEHIINIQELHNKQIINIEYTYNNFKEEHKKHINNIQESHNREIHNIKESHNREINNNKESYNREVDNIKESYNRKIDNIEQAHKKEINNIEVCGENFKQQYKKEVHNIEEFLKEKYTKQINELEELCNKREQLYNKQINTIREEHQIQINSINESHNKHVDILCNEKIKDTKYYSNTSIGNEGENKVYQALIKNQKYHTLKIEDVSQKLGGGDLNVYLAEYDLSLLLEIKNWKTSIHNGDIERFTGNYNMYFTEQIRSHAIMFSVGSIGFAGKPDFCVEEVNIDNNKHLVMYCSNINMSHDNINHNFNYFIDRIRDIDNAKEVANTKDNEYILCNIIDKAIKYLCTQNTKLQENKKNCEKQIKDLDIQIKDTNNLIKVAENILNEYDYNYMESDLSNATKLISILKNNNISIDDYESFKMSVKSKYKNIDNLITGVLSNVNEYKTYKKLYDYIMKYI